MDFFFKLLLLVALWDIGWQLTGIRQSLESRDKDE